MQISLAKKEIKDHEAKSLGLEQWFSTGKALGGDRPEKL